MEPEIQKQPEFKTKRYPLAYRGNVLILILFLLIFPPLGLVLLLLNASVRQGNTFYGMHYNGSQFWLLFWTIVFFPIALVLAIINGFDLVEVVDSR